MAKSYNLLLRVLLLMNVLVNFNEGSSFCTTHSTRDYTTRLHFYMVSNSRVRKRMVWSESKGEWAFEERSRYNCKTVYLRKSVSLESYAIFLMNKTTRDSKKENIFSILLFSCLIMFLRTISRRRSKQGGGIDFQGQVQTPDTYHRSSSSSLIAF